MAHGQTYYYGMMFKEKKEGDSTLVYVDRLQPESEARRSGLSPGSILSSIGTVIDEKPNSLSVRTVEELLDVAAYLTHYSGNKTLRFNFFTNPSRKETKPYFFEPFPSEVLPVHPTQLYSSSFDLFLCCLLLAFSRWDFFRRVDGRVFTAFLLLYPIGRFCIEIIRTDEDSFLGTGLTVSQNVSILVFLAGIFLFLYTLASRPSTEKKTPS